MSAIKHTSQRVAVFIDTQNLYHTAKHIYDSRVHFGKVVDTAVMNRSLVRALAYVITTESRDEQNFFEALEKMGIEIKTKDLQTFLDGSKKADWDVAIAVDAIRISPRVDSVVIVSGDGDFVPLVQFLQHIGVQVEVVAFGSSISNKLREAADIFTDLSENPSQFLINYKHGYKKNYTNNNRRNFQKKENQDAHKTKTTQPDHTANPDSQDEDKNLIPLSDNSYTVPRKMVKRRR